MSSDIQPWQGALKTAKGNVSLWGDLKDCLQHGHRLDRQANTFLEAFRMVVGRKTEMVMFSRGSSGQVGHTDHGHDTATRRSHMTVHRAPVGLQELQGD